MTAQPGQPVVDLDLHRDPGPVRTECGKNRKRQTRGDIAAEADAQSAGRPVAQGAEEALQIVELQQVPFDQRHQEFAGRSQANAAWHAVEYGEADLFLEALDGAVERRGRNRKPFGRLADGAFAAHEAYGAIDPEVSHAGPRSVLRNLHHRVAKITADNTPSIGVHLSAPAKYR